MKHPLQEVAIQAAEIAREHPEECECQSCDLLCAVAQESMLAVMKERS